MHRKPALILAAALVVLLVLPSGAAAVSRQVKILGGSVAAPGQFPWMTALVDARARRAFDGQFCGGTVVAPRVVATAAHCLDDVDPAELHAVVGRTRLTQESDGERIPVSAIVRHPDWNPQTLVGDLALLQLARPTNAPALPMAGAAELGMARPGARVLVIGWGATSEGGASSDDLLFVRLRTTTDAACDKVYGGVPGATVLCAGSKRSGEDSCQGDSGGPLFAGEGTATRLVGIVSYGQGCGRKRIPGVYTRVTAYREWLDGQVAFLNGDAAAPPVPARPPTIRIQGVACARICTVDLRVTGRKPAGGILVNVVRRRTRGHRAVDRYLFAKEVAPGRWRVRNDLPFGRLTIYAIPLNKAQDDLDGDGDVERVEIVAG